MDEKDVNKKYLLSFRSIKKVMKAAGSDLWLPGDTVNLMRILTEDYIRDMTAKACIIARNSKCKYRIRKRDLEIAGGIL